LRRSRDQGIIVTKRYETWTTGTKHDELSVSRPATSRPDRTLSEQHFLFGLEPLKENGRRNIG
jgi:hypothetical protein